MAYQTTYDQTQPAGVPGMLADMQNWNGFTRTAGAAIGFGVPVQRSGNKGCMPLVSGGEFIGITRMRHLVTGGGDAYAQYDNVPVIDEAGGMWALADAAIAVGAALNWNTATGRYTTAAVLGSVIAVPGAEADTAATGAGSLFKLRLRRVPS